MRVLERTSLVTLISSVVTIIFFLLCFLYFSFDSERHNEKDLFSKTMPVLSENYSTVLIGEFWMKIPKRWFSVYPNQRVDLMNSEDAPLFAERINLLFSLEELTGDSSPLAHSAVSVTITEGVEVDLFNFFHGKGESWTVKPDLELGLSSYKKDDEKIGAIYFLPIDENVKTRKGNALYYWCQTTDKREPYLCVGRFEVAKGLIVEYKINIDFLGYWREIHSAIARNVNSMIAKT